jgi:hypothetical protein
MLACTQSLRDGAGKHRTQPGLPPAPHVNVPGESHHPIQGRRLRISTYRRSPEVVLLGRPCERLTHVYKFIVHAPSD